MTDSGGGKALIGVVVLVAAALGFWAGQGGGGDSAKLEEIDRKVAALAEAIGVELAAAEPAEINIADSPVRGPEDAPVVMVEFSDFECPYCLRAHPTVQRVLEEYPDEVKLVFKHFPLSFHKNAVNAHRAVLAAREQGQFWEMHDLIFEAIDDLSVDRMMSHAEKLGLDSQRFRTAFESDLAQEAIDRDMEEGRQAGVRGTPAFFINGRYMAGAQPFEVFKQAIDEALAETAS
ncbi:MAG: thioredoxin domain-containing protein [Myxococcales bacterium]|nr:thioredoxin domain-containing protein [Myxococcales bacterium]